MSIKLDDNLLDILMHKIAEKSLEIVTEVCYDKADPEKIQYLARVFTEIIGVIITASPTAEVQQTYDNVCKWLKGMVAMNMSLDKIMPNADKPSLKTSFQDRLFMAKKPEDIN